MHVPLPKTWWIEPGRLLGGPYPGASHAEERDAKLKALADFGVERMVCLQEAGETGGFGRGFEDYVPRLVELAGRPIDFARFPIRDMSVPSADLVAQILAHLRASPALTYVHCWGGHGRTGVVAGCWHREAGLGPEDTLAALASARAHDPWLRTQPCPQTPEQIALVRSWR